MICSELMSNKIDFNKVTFKTCSSNCLEYLATKIEKDIENYSKSTGTISTTPLNFKAQPRTQPAVLPHNQHLQRFTGRT